MPQTAAMAGARTKPSTTSRCRQGWQIAQEARHQLQNYNWSASLEACDRVLQDDPHHLGALEVKAQALWFAGRYDAVVAVTTQLLRLNPSEPGYRYTRGMANLSRGKFEDSRRDFEYAISQSDNESFRSQVREAMDSLTAWQLNRNGGCQTAVTVH
jgi:tetratricopeptide (TPR) repeat protein